MRGLQGSGEDGEGVREEEGGQPCPIRGQCKQDFTGACGVGGGGCVAEEAGLYYLPKRSHNKNKGAFVFGVGEEIWCPTGLCAQVAQ